ncbi:DNA-directed RNA polymerase sigma-70 factor [Nocardioides baekrokdamisoli]|uniref:DNA-directed RNA polymerase sigma-70 factor n=1 Tax=Nocardioides baekrokdamisoli TaxID=1804624 RepID=A0A3G9IFF8_9ACTN|nr:sigma-70 family RNA polymerase sigma factor [Nocardioides baekrokdamisoli]BBH17780.1 DNA-directed RNA polymerase sigma-70 factor [Nocardioides baekrokdamisoli]
MHKQGVNAPSESSAPDSELLLRSRTDADAFSLIYQRHSVAVHMFLARRLGRDAANDLLSEVFLRALEARHRTRPHESGSALPWLYGIARNMVRTHVRASKVRPIDDPSPPFDWGAVDSRLDADAMSAELRIAIGALTDLEREVLLLVSWEQLPIGEVAAVLGISANAARQRLHRARARAAAALAAVTHPFQNQEN